MRDVQYVRHLSIRPMFTTIYKSCHNHTMLQIHATQTSKDVRKVQLLFSIIPPVIVSLTFLEFHFGMKFWGRDRFYVDYTT
jgi:galactose-1-phosphate uridylyltransferase